MLDGYRRDALMIGLAVGVFGAAFGALATTAGLTVAQASAMSVLVFTGASQFTAVSIIGSGGSPAAGLAAALLLAARNGFYGITMSRYLTGSTLRRAVGAQLTIDESTALAVAQPEPDVEPAFWAGGVSVFVFWNLGTLAGAWGGDQVSDPALFGLDAAFPAGFVALMVPALKNRPGLVAALVGAGIAITLTPFTQPGIPILAASLGAVVAMWATPPVAAAPPAEPSPG